MAAMLLPDLFRRSTRFTITNTRNILQKFGHLIKWKEDETILEFGFAEGSNSQLNLGPILPSDYKEFIGVDISKYMVNYAKNNVVIPRSEFVQLDIANKHLPAQFEQRFDHVLSLFTMHMNIAEQAFKNIHCMLKIQGETFQIFFDRLPVEHLYDELSRHPRWGKYGHEIMVTPYLNSNPKDVYQKAITTAGFKDVIFEEDDITYTYPNEQEWKDLFFSVNPLVEKIPKEEIEDYKIDYFDGIRSKVLHQETKEDGTINDKISFKAFIVSARKS